MSAVIRQRFSMLLLWGLCQIAALIASLWMLAAALAGADGPGPWRSRTTSWPMPLSAGTRTRRSSSRAGKAARQGKRWACLFCHLLDRFDPDHCEKAIEPDSEGQAAEIARRATRFHFLHPFIPPMGGFLCWSRYGRQFFNTV